MRVRRTALAGPAPERFGRRNALRRIALAFAPALQACAGTSPLPPAAPVTGQRPPPAEPAFTANDLAKSDIDAALEVPARECLASARLVMVKLYQRNPQQWRKGRSASAEAAVARAFDVKAEFRFAELERVRGSNAILLALKPSYAGDRVFAFGVGLGSMVWLSYNGRTQFTLIDSLDPQKLYNCARNVELAAWKLSTAKGDRGEPLLLSNEIAGDAQNLSFEREFGKMIAYQDTMAQIVAQRTNRIVRRVVQGVATAVFLPI